MRTKSAEELGVRLRIYYACVVCRHIFVGYCPYPRPAKCQGCLKERR